MMRGCIWVLVFLYGVDIVAQKGAVFPSMSGVLLNEKSINLPLKNSKCTIVAIAYNRSAEDALKKWLNPLYNMFIVKKKDGESNVDMAEIYDVNFVFVPMISGFKKIARDFKAGTDAEFWPYIMDTEKTDIKAVQKSLNVSDEKIPYFYVIDKLGKILLVESGEYSDDKMDAIEDAVE